MKPFTPYAASKAAGDHVANSYVETFHLDTVIVRPFNTFGPRQNEGTHAGVIPLVIQRILEGKPIKIFGSGEQTRDYTFVRDTAEAALRIYETEETRGKEINVCTGREVSINDLITTILNIMGIPDYPIEYTSERPGDVMRHLGDPSLLVKLVDFKPMTNFNKGMKETLEWYLFDSILDVPQEIKERFRATNNTVNR
jgi:UDP-glucose 4-epimerase